MANTIMLATRKSPLALKQAEMTMSWLQVKLPEDSFELLGVSTKVDERLSWSLEKRGGIGLFTKELEEALLDKRAELAVHSAKDMPTSFQNDLSIAGYLPRAKANDVLVVRNGKQNELKSIASSSPRRRAQVGKIHSNANWTAIRGNVGTRLKKITEGDADASLIAAAGLERLGIDSYEGLEFIELSIDECVPAPGQAAIAIQCRSSDLEKYEHLFVRKPKSQFHLNVVSSNDWVVVAKLRSEHITTAKHFMYFIQKLDCNPLNLDWKKMIKSRLYSPTYYQI